MLDGIAKTKINNYIDHYEESDRRILRDRYIDNKTLEEIYASLNISDIPGADKKRRRITLIKFQAFEGYVRMMESKEG